MFISFDNRVRRALRPAAFVIATGFAAAAWSGSATALTTTTGVAVDSVGSSTQVGTTVTRSAPSPLAGFGPAIKYFIPLGDSNGTYGVSGFGLSSDYGNGGGKLSMILRFDPVNIGPANLLIRFEDLDLAGANDPFGFFETLRVFNSANVALTPLITSINDPGVSGDANGQTLSLALNVLSNPLFLVLKFKANFGYNYGHNTAEYLIATITSPDGGVGEVPLPPAALLFGSVLAGGGLFARYRRKRATA